PHYLHGRQRAVDCAGRGCRKSRANLQQILMSIQERFGVPFLQKPPGAGQTDPDTESKRVALLEKLQGVTAGDDSKE
uniref:hypothetical protein n=1 Tax=Gemmiger formicilis TaxID=745368 RepID=UPI004028A8CF